MVPLLIALAFAVGLAYLAFDAARAQRSAARRTVNDFADFAAFIIAQNAQQEIERRLLYAFGSVRSWDPASGEALPEPEAIGRERTEAERCAPSGLTEPTYARLDLRSDPGSALTLAGAPISEAAARWLADTLAVEATTAFRDGWTFAHIFSDTPGLSVVAYTVLRDEAGSPVAAYAKSSCIDIGGTSVFRLATRSSTALPPTLTGGLPNDSILALSVRTTQGSEVFGQRPVWTSGATGSAGPLEQLGNVRVLVDIRQDAADRLVVGGIPYGGTPMALLLLLLVLGFGALAYNQVRRQQALISARERFISSVSHELRTPLQQILVFIELLGMDKLESPDERRHSIAVIERETRRLIQLVENVLAFARARRDEIELASGPIEITQLTRETIQTFEPLARMSRATIDLRADAPVRACGDASAIRRILLNLLDNAVKYGPVGQTIGVSVARVDGFATITVDDQGSGIPQAARPSVWEPFQRLDESEDAPVVGSGMGLSIVRDLATAMGGVAHIEDAPGGGARVVIAIPAAPASDEE